MRLRTRMRERSHKMLTNLLALTVLATGSSSAWADWTPERNVEIIIASAPGGGTDRSGRVLQKLLKDLALVPTPITVLNKPGAGGFLACAQLNQEGDGHTISQRE